MPLSTAPYLPAPTSVSWISGRPNLHAELPELVPHHILRDRDVVVHLPVVHLELQPDEVGQDRGRALLRADRHDFLARRRAHNRESGGGNMSAAGSFVWSWARARAHDRAGREAAAAVGEGGLRDDVRSCVVGSAGSSQLKGRLGDGQHVPFHTDRAIRTRVGSMVAGCGWVGSSWQRCRRKKLVGGLNFGSGLTGADKTGVCGRAKSGSRGSPDLDAGSRRRGNDIIFVFDISFPYAFGVVFLTCGLASV